MRRGIVDNKGEQFAYVEGDTVFTYEGEASGRLGKNYIYDLADNRVWRVVGDGIYTLDGNQPIGYIMAAPSQSVW